MTKRAHLQGTEEKPQALLAGHGLDPEQDPWKTLGIQAQLTVLLHPRGGPPWVCGLHQCDSARQWTLQEEQLLQEISRRLADSLTNLLMYRNLEENRRFLDTVIQNIPNMLFVKEAESLRFVCINKAGEQLLGYDRNEFIGKNDYDFFPKEEADLFTAKDRELFKYKEVVDIPEESIQTKEGKIRLLHTKKLPVFDENGEPKFIMGISEDITERKKLEAQYQQAQKMESIGRLAGGVAHHFNNMLGAIIGNLEIAMMTVDPSQSLYKRLQNALIAAERSAQITRQLLDFASTQAITSQVADLNEMVTDMIETLKVLVGEQIELIWSPGAELWPVQIDRAQIDQILTNLCVNARDSIADAGTISLETRNIASDLAFHQSHPESTPGDYVLLSVSDTGSGMDQETLAKTFEPFFTTKEVGKGTGLGLATVHGIVIQNQGFIDVTSSLGRGTTFSVYLPRR
nr:ATP-binding protein [uncultured Desulfobulbus sp.]